MMMTDKTVHYYSNNVNICCVADVDVAGVDVVDAVDVEQEQNHCYVHMDMKISDFIRLIQRVDRLIITCDIEGECGATCETACGIDGDFLASLLKCKLLQTYEKELLLNRANERKRTCLEAATADAAEPPGSSRGGGLSL